MQFFRFICTLPEKKITARWDFPENYQGILEILRTPTFFYCQAFDKYSTSLTDEWLMYMYINK